MRVGSLLGASSSRCPFSFNIGCTGSKRCKWCPQAPRGWGDGALDAHALRRVSIEKSVGNNDVKVHVEVQATAEALGKADGSAAQFLFRCGRRGEANSDPDGPLPPKDLLDEDAPHCRKRFRLLREHESQLEGDRQNPLTESNVGQDLVHEVRSRVRHPSGIATRTDPALLARESDEEHRSA